MNYDTSLMILCIVGRPVSQNLGTLTLKPKLHPGNHDDASLGLLS
jgi:hypothetical protein